MKPLKVICDNLHDNMAKAVINYRLSTLTEKLESTTMKALNYYTFRFYESNTLQLDNPNPVVYGVAVRDFIEYVDKTMPKTHSLDDELNEFMANNWHTFIDELQMFTHANIEDIEVKSNL